MEWRQPRIADKKLLGTFTFDHDYELECVTTFEILFASDNVWVRRCQLLLCKRIGPEKIWALVPKILGVPRLPPGGSLGTCKSRHGAENVDLYAVQDQFCCGYNQGACVAYTLHSRQ